MKILYLSWTGLAEPLGRSQVLAYLKPLALRHEITLITMEKESDWKDLSLMDVLEKKCAEHGITWKRGKYHKSPRALARPYDFIVFATLALQSCYVNQPDVVHARSYVAATVAHVIHKFRRIPYVFDTRSLWPEELVVSGRLMRGSLLHRAIAWVELALFENAAAVVFLTKAAARRFQGTPPIGDRPVVVIPTCADLNAFRPVSERSGSGAACFGTVGSVTSGWFRLSWLMDFFKAALTDDPTVTFRITSRDDEEIVRRAAESAGLPQDRLVIQSSPPEAMPARLRELDALAMFFETGASKIASCPTRMAEALGCGIPIVANAGVGDVAEIILNRQVGVIVNENSPEGMAQALRSLRSLLSDPELADRCRRTALELFSVDNGAKSYDEIYNIIMSRTSHM